jgi:hypothetical protein
MMLVSSDKIPALLSFLSVLDEEFFEIVLGLKVDERVIGWE